MSACPALLRFALPALALALLSAAPAWAQQHCAPREIIVGRLAEKYGESRQSIALSHGNQMVEVFASAATGSWTITVTRPGGMTCLMASGKAYETLTEQLPPKKKDA
ncbi:hypothetical protein ACRARG_08450 [Pseudooceanicola sp. C21-150M6]|uniref:hypothetical protein n=1 Tax=Pseudooceanicola sp. C21-150M6 TaxID=3434355 RepID=UPI003D7F2B0D